MRDEYDAKTLGSLSFGVLLPFPELRIEASDAVLLLFNFGAIIFVPGVALEPVLAESFGPSPLIFTLIAGSRAGRISLANSLTSTAPSSSLNLLTTSLNPYLSTKPARPGCASQAAFRSLKRFNRTTARPCVFRRAMTRWKNWAREARPIVIREEMRNILSRGSRRFSKECDLALTKHLSSDSSAEGTISSSSILDVSSCSLPSQVRLD